MRHRSGKALKVPRNDRVYEYTFTAPIIAVQARSSFQCKATKHGKNLAGHLTFES